MGDFYQNGLVPTLHNFGTRTAEDLESELIEFSSQRPMSLIIPCLITELEGPALANIIKEISKVPYLREIVIGLDGATAEQYEYAKEYFSVLPQYHRVLWNDGPHAKELEKVLEKKGLAPGERGKGRNVWYCFGYCIASDKGEAIALHDADILTYNRDLLARLLYPVANPNLTYRYCKGYYFRAHDNKLKGRVTRLLVTPLLRALKKIFGPHNYLEYLDSFRYPLAGEFSMRIDVIKTIRIPYDWGLEIGVLSEVHRNNPTSRICQVDIAGAYDHKHQPLSEDDPTRGLSRMSTEICLAIFRKLAANGLVFSQETFRSLKSTYYRIALDIVEQYYSDAVMNGFFLDRHEEENTVELFTHNIVHAGELFINNPMQSPTLPNWKRISSAFPDFLENFYNYVEDDNNRCVTSPEKLYVLNKENLI
jgi:glucosyl-3-phosphoglycerate synthase